MPSVRVRPGVGSTSPRVVPIPWRNYDHEWNWITTEDGILLNLAGCLDREELDRKEDEGVARAMELVAGLLDRTEPVPLTVANFSLFGRADNGHG